LITLPQEIDVIQTLMQPGDQLFLVGGAVRDTLLSKPNQDLDFVCAADPRIVGRKLAEKLSGAFFMLDDDRNACRVIAKNDRGGRLVFDFTQMRGETLEADLSERDFTINAIAVDLSNPIDIIDPLHGKQDLFEMKLRPCKGSSFHDDPLRVIRAIRYSIKYDLQMDASTIEALKKVVGNLSSISKERKRDEIFKILELDKPWLALKFFEQYNILAHVSMDNLPDKASAFSRLRIHSQMINCLAEDELEENIKDEILNEFRSMFSLTRVNLRNRFCQVNQSERSIQALDGLIALLWDLDESQGAKAAEGLALSREEQEQICLSLKFKCCILEQFSSQTIPDRKFLYRYFQVLGIAGLDVAILSLADAAIHQSVVWKEDHWFELVQFCHILVETWFVNPDYVNPKLFLTGRDLMFEFDIPQGPRIGQLLDGLREEQAIGSIQNRTQAMAWVDGQLQKGFLAG
jgi:tRNA nucleotidyltransferase/poly(A) polymerase